MHLEAILSVVGSLLVIVGAINAFFIKGLITKIESIHLDLVTTQINHTNIAEKVVRSENSIQEHTKRFEDVRFRLHKLEGGQGSLLELYKMSDERIKVIEGKVSSIKP